MVPLQQHYCRLARSAALILACLLALPAGAAVCANPGRDGAVAPPAAPNSYFTGPDTQTLAAGTRSFMLSRQRGEVALQAGDLALMLQVQGADIRTDNAPDYGRITGSRLAQEWVRIDRVDGNQVHIQGAGKQGGLIHTYTNAPASGKSGRQRWQLVRVPQLESLTLDRDGQALPWDGFTGGVLALDVRRELDLNGHTLSVAGAGFRGGPAVSLQGALGRPGDWRYTTPSAQDREVGYGHHASKGEGLAGTPTMLTAGGKGYPHGDMGRGAPANAGGGGNGLDLSHRKLGHGGGGGNGQAGEPGQPDEGGGQGGHASPQALVMGGGGGAAARRSGQGGEGGPGGGVMVIRAARLEGPGNLDLRGSAGHPAGTAGGGGGAGGTLWLDLPDTAEVPVTVQATGADGALGGGRGGAGQTLMRSETPHAGFRSLPVAGVEAGYRCRPAGHWVTGLVFEDNGGGNPHLAFNGRADAGEARLSGWQWVLADPSGDWRQAVSTGEGGGFQFRLSEAESRGQALSLSVTVPGNWSLPRRPALGEQPGQVSAGRVKWALQAVADRHSGPLALGVIATPGWQATPVPSLKPGSTAILGFEYRATVTGTVRFDTSSSRVRGLLMDRRCGGDSERWQRGESQGWSVTAGERICVRVPVRVGGDTETVTVTATTTPAGNAGEFAFPVQRASIKMRPAP